MSKVFKNNPQQSKLILEELEERRLFSGGIEGLIVTDLDSEANAIYSDVDGSSTQSGATGTDAVAAEQQFQEIVFVDADVDNYQQLVDDLRNNADSSRNIEVVVLDRDKDGIEEISEFLSHRDDLDAIHIISHGSDGSVELGNTSLNADSLEQNNLKIALWANSFTEAGDILIYGCNLAASEVGQSLISELGSLTLTDVAASNDLTGNASQGGDYDLEFKSGTIDARLALSTELQQSWEGVLVVANDATVAIDENTANATLITTVSATAATEGNYAEIYWLDKFDGAIYKANADGSGGTSTVLTSISTPVGLAIDYNGGKLYWTTNQGGSASKIQSANLDGSVVTDLVTGLVDPDNIALDLANGKMYWTDDGDGQIRRANLNGTGVESLVSGLTSAQGIALDVNGGKMYWTDYGTNKIQRANLDGSAVEDLVTGLTDPDDVELDLVNGKMYWVDFGAGSVHRADLDGGNAEDLITAGLSAPYYLALDVPAGKMYWTDDGSNKIQRANFDGSGVEDLVTIGTGDPRDLVLSAPSTLSGPLSYSITAGNTGNAFAINASTGEITVADGSALDFETTPIFNLTVEVQDTVTLASDTATITINLNNVNDPPIAIADTYSVDEDGSLVVDLVSGAPSADLAGYWDMDGVAPSQTLTDSSGGADGTLGNSAGVDTQDPVWTTSSQVGSAALSFDGVDDYVQTTNNTLQTANSFTISSWFQTDTTTGQHHMIWQGVGSQNGFGDPGGTAANSEMHITIGTWDQDNVISFFWGYDEANADSVEIISSAFTDTTDWHHVAVVVTDLGLGAVSAELFIDGVSEGSDTGTQTDRSAWDTNMRIGATGAATRFFDGRIDEVRVYDSALSNTDVDNLYRVGVLANDSDPEGDGLTVNTTPVSGPSNGSLTLAADGTFTYTPDADFSGVDSFVYEIDDGNSNTAQASVTITVNPVNDAPTGSVTIDNTTPSQGDTLAANNTLADADGLSGAISYQWQRDGGDIVGATSASYTTTQADVGSVITVVASYTDDDGGNEIVSSNGTAAVLDVNDTPVIGGADTGTVTEDSAVVGGNISAAGGLTITDEDPGESSFQAATISGTYGDLTIDAAGNWNYSAINAQALIQALDNGESLTDTLTVTTFDGSTHNVVITINGAEDLAVISGTTTGSVTEDGTLTSSGTLTISDTDTSDTPGFADVPSTVGDNGYGNFVMTSGTWTYTLNNAHPAVQALDVTETLSDTHTFSATDGSTQVVTVTINGAEDTPVFDSTAVTAATEDAVYSYTITTSDVDVESVTITAPTLPAWLTFVDNGDGTATLSGTPVNAEVGSHNVVLNVSDGTLSSNQNFTIVVGNTNDPAVIGGTDTGAVQEDVAVVANNISTSGTLTITDPDTGESSFQAATITGIYGDLVMQTNGDWTYTADNTQTAIQQLDTGESLTDTLTVTSFDGTTHNVVITINGSEDAAVISGTTTGSVTEDGTLTSSGTLTISDTDTSDIPGFADVPSTVGDNGYGNFVMTSGTWTYTLNNAHPAVQALDVTETLTDTYTFAASDGSTQIVSVTINGAEDTAVIGGIATGMVAEDGALTVSDTLTITDTDASDNPLSYLDVAPSLGANGYGDFEITSNTWTYTLNNAHAAVQALDVGETLTDSYTFTASDGSTRTVTATINGAEDTVVIAGTTTGSVTEDGTLTSSGTLTISDTDTSDTPGFADVGITAGDNAFGTFEMTAGTWTYTLNNAHPAVQALDVTETLTDTHTFTATDGSTQVVTVTINGAEDAPVFDSTAITAATEDVAYSYTITTSDVDVENVTITAPTLPTWLSFVDNGNGTATLSGTPTNAEVGNHNVVLNVSDGTLNSNQNFTIVVDNTNDSAVIGGADTGTVQEDVGVVGTDISTSGILTIADPDAGESSFVAATINGTYGDLTIDSAGNWSYSADNSQISIQALDALESITDTLTVTTFDGTTHNVLITINGTEDAAVTGGTASGSVTEDSSLSVTDALTITDVDVSDNPVSFSDVGPTPGANGYGNFEITGNTWTYTLINGHAAVQALDVGETLTDSYTFTATDGSTQLVTVTINGAEDAPTLDNAIADQTATEDVAFNFTFAANTFGDLDTSDTLIYSATLADSSPLPGWLNFDAATRTFSGTPANPDVGPIDIRITADDGSSTVTDTFTLTVLNVNDAPLIGGDDTGAVTEDVGVIGGIISTTGSLTITDPDAGESSFQPATVTGSYGDLSIDISGNWIYDANNNQSAIQALDAGQSIIDTLTVSAFDGSTHDIVITINGAEDSAVIGGTAVGAVTEDSALVVSDTLMITDVDSNDNPISFNDVAITPGSNGYGSFEMTGNTWSYTLNNGHASVQALDVGETLTDTYTFAASDGSTQVVTVTINGSEDAPVIGGTSTGAVSEDGVLAASATLTISDTDSSDNPISFNDVTPTPGVNGYGSFEMSGNTWTYTLNNSHAAVQALDVGETLTDLFTFNASDGSTQIVTITIGGAEDAPTLDNAIADQTATEDAAFNFTFAANTFADLDASDTLIYSATLADSSPLPGWLSFDAATRTFSGTPANADVGPIDIRITADDGSSTVTDTFTLTVLNVNDAPLIGGDDSGAMTEDVGVIGGIISTTGSLTIADVDAGESSFVGSTVKGALGALTIDTDGNWRYSADNGNPEIQALQGGESITETLTVTTADGTTHDVVITINGAAEAAPSPPPPVVEPPLVEPPPEAEPPPEEEAETGGGVVDPVVDEIVRAPQDVTPPPVQEVVDNSGYLQQEQAEADKAETSAVKEKYVAKVIEQPRIEAVQQQNLSLDALTLQVSDDEALNEKYELELLSRIDSMHRGMDGDAAQTSADDIEVQIVMGSTASLTAGIVSWVLRGGSLLASFMSTVPLLNRFDPLPILKSREEKEDVEEDTDDDDAETKFKKHQKRVDNMFSGKDAAREQDRYMNE